MKYMLLGIFIFFFVGVPLYLLSALVMPELNQLQYAYAHQDETVERLFPGASQ